MKISEVISQFQDEFLLRGDIEVFVADGDDENPADHFIHIVDEGDEVIGIMLGSEGLEVVGSDEAN